MTTCPSQSSQSFMYLETTIPAGTTISEYRRSRPRNPRLLRRVYAALPLPRRA